MSDKIVLYLVFVVTFAACVRSDYDCLCNYNVEKGIYPSASEQGQPTGYMYEFDCKPVVSQSTESNDWIVIAFEHQKGYVLKDVQTQVQTCAGESPSEDKLTTVEVQTSLTSLSTLSHEPMTSTLQTSPSTTMSSTSVVTTAATSEVTTETVKTTFISTTTTSSSTVTNPKTTTIPPTETEAATTIPPTETKAATTVTTTPSTTTTPVGKSAETITTTSKIPSTTVLSTGSVSSNTTTVGQVMCPLAVQQQAHQEGGTLFINSNDRTCYELVPYKRTWISAENDCVSKGGHLATIGNLKDEEVVYNYVKSYKHVVWIGLHDRNNEETFEWSSGEPVVYLRWHVGRKNPFLHRIEDCVAMGPLTGTWEDMDCLDRYSYICEFAAYMNAVNGGKDNFQSTTPAHIGSYTDGNTANCPSSVKLAASRDNGVLGQYGRSCYELVSHNKVRWEHGESMCKGRGGHLAHISSKEEQGFIQSFMTRHFPQHAVWIGLHDTRVEGQMEWTSGSSVTYTNWVPGHLGNFESFRTEDCVAFIPYKNGQWDDIPCGDHSFFFGDTGETHPILCQYAMMTSSTIVG